MPNMDQMCVVSAHVYSYATGSQDLYASRDTCELEVGQARSHTCAIASAHPHARASFDGRTHAHMSRANYTAEVALDEQLWVSGFRHERPPWLGEWP